MQDFRQLSLIKIHISLLTTYNEIQLEERYNFLYFTVIVAIYSRKNKLTDSNCRAPYIPPRYSFVAYFIKSLVPSGRMALNCYTLNVYGVQVFYSMLFLAHSAGYNSGAG